MIVVDTSALMAFIASEPAAEQCQAILEREREILMSAATVTEALIVAEGRGISADMRYIIETSVTEIVELTSNRAELAADAYRLWGKGFHPAYLNFGDCFSYATAKEFDCPLLYIGNDFSKTDVKSAIPRSTP